MKSFFKAAALAFALVCALFCGCNAGVDLTGYISEMRSGMFLYSDDFLTLKVYCVSREQPYCADGFCGNVCSLVEIYATFAQNPQSVEAHIGADGGEMNYEGVNSRYVLSFTHEAYAGEGVDVDITLGEKEKTYRALNVADGSIISCKDALRCAEEYDGGLFAGLKTKRDFKGEIFVRLLYDEGCYYYVGVCDRDKNLTAYLLDGVKGKVIATKKMKAD